MTLVLTSSLLDGLRERWRSRQIPLELASGQSEAELRSASEAAGLVLPPELVVWWTWQDGIHREPGQRPLSLITPKGFMPLPFADAVTQTREYYGVVANIGAGDDELRSWLSAGRWLTIGPVFGGNVFVDLEPQPDGTSRVRRIDHEEMFDEPLPPAPSLGTVIDWWTAALDSGYYGWDAENGTWKMGPERPTGEPRTTCLV